jgi:hypothetical protein
MAQRRETMVERILLAYEGSPETDAALSQAADAK